MRRLMAVVVLAIAPLSACSVNFSHEIKREDLETEVANMIEQKSGTAPESVSCDETLEHEVGASTNCTITIDGEDSVIPVEVTSVEGDEAEVSVPATLTKSDLEANISQQLEAQAGTPPDKIECPGALVGKIGETMQCVLEHQGTKLPVDIKVTEVDGAKINYDIEVGTKPLE